MLLLYVCSPSLPLSGSCCLSRLSLVNPVVDSLLFAFFYVLVAHVLLFMSSCYCSYFSSYYSCRLVIYIALFLPFPLLSVFLSVCFFSPLHHLRPYLLSFHSVFFSSSLYVSVVLLVPFLNICHFCILVFGCRTPNRRKQIGIDSSNFCLLFGFAIVSCCFEIGGVPDRFFEIFTGFCFFRGFVRTLTPDVQSPLWRRCPPHRSLNHSDGMHICPHMIVSIASREYWPYYWVSADQLPMSVQESPGHHRLNHSDWVHACSHMIQCSK